ncbi:MAG: tetratricopeptide repeat protein [Acidobacteria bacterium]|nr:tetratricopeptide repeat protein [Acidobacteriota bacterium]
MNTCPQCNQVYYDDTNFCLNDGATLVPASQIPTAPQIEMPTVVRSASPVSPVRHTVESVPQPNAQPIMPATEGVAARHPYVVIGIVLLLLLGVGLGIYFLRSPLNGPTEPAKNPSADSRAGNSAGADQNKQDAIDKEKGNLKTDEQKLEEERKRLEEGEKAAELAKAEPDNYDAQMKAADHYYQTSKFDSAIKTLNQARRLNPEASEPMFMLGNTYYEKKSMKTAGAWYEKALEKSPNNVPHRGQLGLTYLNRPKPNVDRAIREFNRALEIDPKNPRILYNLTSAYATNGEAANARATLARLEQLDSGMDLVELRKYVAELKK